ncbi:hypothetical protein LINPERHAP2_LOCUS27604 [Linum perenne]
MNKGNTKKKKIKPHLMIPPPATFRPSSVERRR